MLNDKSAQFNTKPIVRYKDVTRECSFQVEVSTVYMQFLRLLIYSLLDMRTLNRQGKK